MVTIFWTNTPAFCRQLTGKPSRLDLEGSRFGPEPEDVCRGIMGIGVDWTGRTLATGFSSVTAEGRLYRLDSVTPQLNSLRSFLVMKRTSSSGWRRGCWWGSGHWRGNSGRMTGGCTAPRRVSPPRTPSLRLSSQRCSASALCGPSAETREGKVAAGKKRVADEFCSLTLRKVHKNTPIFTLTLYKLTNKQNTEANRTIIPAFCHNNQPRSTKKRLFSTLVTRLE